MLNSILSSIISVRSTHLWKREGSTPLTSGTGSVRPKNIQILWIRIRIPNTDFKHSLMFALYYKCFLLSRFAYLDCMQFSLTALYRDVNKQFAPLPISCLFDFLSISNITGSLSARLFLPRFLQKAHPAPSYPHPTPSLSTSPV